MTTRLVRLPEVSRLTGLPPSTIYAMIAKGRFPRGIKLSERSSAWRSDELDQWIEERTRESRSDKVAV
jgi:prophage regulatory protein